MTDAFAKLTTGLESPATHLETVTPSDTDDLALVSRAINVATSGSIRVTALDGSTETLHVTAGIAFPVRVRRVWATGTTATGIVALS
jgi:hypothetical protein